MSLMLSILFCTYVSVLINDECYGYCRIGVEHEKFGFELKTLKPMTYVQIADLLNAISERFDWENIMQGDNIFGLKQVINTAYLKNPKLLFDCMWSISKL